MNAKRLTGEGAPRRRNLTDPTHTPGVHVRFFGDFTGVSAVKNTREIYKQPRPGISVAVDTLALAKLVIAIVPAHRTAQL